MFQARQLIGRVFGKMPAERSLVDLAPDVARTILRSFIVLAVVGESLGPLVDCVWHWIDASHPMWFATHWLNLGLAGVWAVSLWASYILPLYAAVVFFGAVSIAAGAVTIFLTGGIDSPNAIFFAIPILVGPLFLGLRGSSFVLLMALGAYASLYVLEAHVGIVAPAMERADYGLTYTIIVLIGFVAIWLMGWLIGASLRYPLYDRIRASATQDALLAERERLLAMVSHELRTPLTNIVGFVEMMRHRATDFDEDMRQGLHSNALQLLTMVNNLLDYAKIKQADQDWAPEPLSVPVLCEQVLAMFSPALTRQNTVSDLRRDPADFPMLMLDKFALERILINLVSNAVKHTKNGRVLMDVAWHAGQLTIKVVDTGAGMSAQTLARVFEPFFHDSHSGVAGTGLGMALVQQMVQRMGGQIQVVSEIGKGTSVTLQLAGTAQAGVPAVTSHAMVQPAKAAAGGLYLFVEDQPDIRTLIEAFAQTLGIRAVVVAGLEDVPLAQGPFTAAFVDLQLSGASGVDAMQQLKAFQPDLPVWAMTANMMFRPDVVATSGRQFDGVIYKPFSLQQLEDALGAVGSSRLRA